MPSLVDLDVLRFSGTQQDGSWPARIEPLGQRPGQVVFANHIEQIPEALDVVIDDANKASRRPVTIGLVATDQVEVLEGLVEGDRVVVAGASLLSEGALARIVGG